MRFVPTDQYGDLDDPEPYEQAIDMAIEALQGGDADMTGTSPYMQPSRHDDGRSIGSYMTINCPFCGKTFNMHTKLKSKEADVVTIDESI